MCIYKHVISCAYAHTYLKIAPTNIKSLINEKCRGVYCCSPSCGALHSGNVFRGQSIADGKLKRMGIKRTQTNDS